MGTFFITFDPLFPKRCALRRAQSDTVFDFRLQDILSHIALSSCIAFALASAAEGACRRTDKATTKHYNSADSTLITIDLANLHINAMKQYWVYILECADGTYYTGVTNDLDRRLEEHMLGHDPKAYTYRRRPIKLVWSDDFPDPQQAIDFEKQVKGWRRAKKEALIKDDWEEITRLSNAKHNDPSTSSG